MTKASMFEHEIMEFVRSRSRSAIAPEEQGARWDGFINK